MEKQEKLPLISLTKDQIETMKVAEVRDAVRKLDPADYSRLASLLLQDKRSGIQKLGASLNRQYARHQQALAKCEQMHAAETAAYQKGYRQIAGLDEVGRGPLAGPVVCAAVILPPTSRILHVDDSKKLSARQREALNEQILAEAIDVKIGLRDPEVIDTVNILNATKQAMTEAVARLEPQPDLLLVDAVRLDVPMDTQAVIHGDAVCYSIAAASIVAKVYRDRLMQAYHREYPQYGFDRNMGYGTAEHIAAIKKYGLTPIHRLSFVKNLK